MNTVPPAYIILHNRLLTSIFVPKGCPILSFSAHTCTLSANAAIAHIPHSCIPNAFQHFDRESNEVIIRALEDLPEGTKVTINFEHDIETFLLPKQQRLQHIRSSFGPQLTCTCPACSPVDSINGRDDDLRIETAALLEMIKPLPLLDEDFELSIHTTHINLSQVQKLHKRYVDNLIRLGAKDHKLCHAYWLLYQFHSYIADHADDDETRSRCEQCDFPVHRLTHLEEAVAALQAAIAICVTCYGIRHHKVQELEAEMGILKQKVVDVLSEHIHLNYGELSSLSARHSTSESIKMGN